MTPRRWRVYHGRPGLEAGRLIDLGPEDSHHLLRVLRLTSGAEVGVFDGHGREWLASIVGIEGGAVRLRVGSELRDKVEPALRVVLYQGLCRQDRMDWTIQKATEIGVAEIRLVTCAGSPRGGATPRRLARWERIAREACKQCGRRLVPLVAPVDAPPAAPGPPVRALVLDAGATPLGRLLGDPPPEQVWLAVGPESGLADEERRVWIERGWESAGLGPRTLRAETAGLVAATVVLHRWADVGAGG